MPKVINIEPTPNPNALKFVVGEPLLKVGARVFRDFGAAVGDRLASSVFAIGDVASVFYTNRFLTVNKEPEANWAELIDPVCECIEDYVPKSNDEGVVAGLPASNDEVLLHIHEVLRERIFPGLAKDGGGLDVIDFDGATLRVAFHGACGACPGAQKSTLPSIEAILQQEVAPYIRVISY